MAMKRVDHTNADDDDLYACKLIGERNAKLPDGVLHKEHYQAERTTNPVFAKMTECVIVLIVFANVSNVTTDTMPRIDVRMWF